MSVHAVSWHMAHQRRAKKCQVKWQFKSMDNNTWVEKDILVKMGYIKLVQREDERNSPSPTARPLASSVCDSMR